MRNYLVRFTLGGVALLALHACDGNGDGVNGPGGFTVENYVVGLTDLQQTGDATFIDGQAPTASGGPTLQAEGPATVIWGGAARTRLTADAEFTAVIVSVDGIDGYYRLTVPATSALEVLLRFPQAIPDSTFNIAYQVVTAAEAVSAPAVTVTEAILVEPGVIQLSVAWDSPADLDLHVIDPDGNEIFWGIPSFGQGSLAVTSNEGCTDGPRSETVVWMDEAPRGNYTVRLGVDSLCGAGEANYVVRFRLPGRGDHLFTGTLSATTDNGPGEGVEIATRFY